MRKLVVLSLVLGLGLVACGTKEKTVGSEAQELVKELSKDNNRYFTEEHLKLWTEKLGYTEEDMLKISKDFTEEVKKIDLKEVYLEGSTKSLYESAIKNPNTDSLYFFTNITNGSTYEPYIIPTLSVNQLELRDKNEVTNGGLSPFYRLSENEDKDFFEKYMKDKVGKSFSIKKGENNRTSEETKNAISVLTQVTEMVGNYQGESVDQSLTKQEDGKWIAQEDFIVKVESYKVEEVQIYNAKVKVGKLKASVVSPLYKDTLNYESQFIFSDYNGRRADLSGISVVYGNATKPEYKDKLLKLQDLMIRKSIQVEKATSNDSYLIQNLSKLFEDVVDRFERKAGRRS